MDFIIFLIVIWAILGAALFLTSVIDEYNLTDLNTERLIITTIGCGPVIWITMIIRAVVNAVAHYGKQLNRWMNR